MHWFQCKAQMAESVDALVSNTSGATRAGSTPALGTGSGERAILLRFFLGEGIRHNLHFVNRQVRDNRTKLITKRGAAI